MPDLNDLGVWEDIKSYLTKNAERFSPYDKTGKIDKEKMVESSTNLVGPGGPVANISQLAKSPQAPQEVKGILEYLQRILPKRVDLVRNSKFVTDGLVNPRSVGEYSPGIDSAKIALNSTSGMPRSTKDIITTIFHELFSHGADAEKGVARLGGGEEGLQKYLAKIDNERIQYPAHNTRPSEIKAKRVANYLTNNLEKKGKL
jgi:hypothetical protein